MKKEKATKKNKIYIDLVLLLIMVILIAVVFIHRDKLFIGQTYEFKTAAAAFFGKEGRSYVIDDGKASINILTADHAVDEHINGGSYDRFYYAQSLCEGQKDGKPVLYISDTAYRTVEDEVLEENRVIAYNGKQYTEVYNAGGSRIYEIKSRGSDLYILTEEDSALILIRLGEDGANKIVRRVYCGDVLTGASVDLSTGCIAVATKRGAIRVIDRSDNTWQTLDTEGEHILPGAINIGNGKVFFSDYAGGRVCCFDETDLSSYTQLFAEEDLKIVQIGSQEGVDKILCCDLISFYEVTLSADQPAMLTYVDSLKYNGFSFTVFLWILMVFSVLILVRLLRFIPQLVVRLMHNESALRMTAVIIAVVTVSCFIAWSLISEQHRTEDEADVSNMKLFTDLVVNNIDVDLLSHIRSETDYAGSSYNKLREKLDLLMLEAAEEGRDYYYVFYTVKDGKLQYLLNYYDSVICSEPYGRMDDTYYQAVFRDRDSYALKSKDADGLWLYVLTPVEDENGNCLAVLEIGTDLSYRAAERRAQTLNIGLSVFCSSAVMVMLIVEALLLIGFFERKMKLLQENKQDVTKMIPLRSIILFSYAAATLQDSFITVLASRLYQGSISFIPEQMAAGLPLFLNLLMMAAFAAIGGNLTERLGSRKVLFIGLFTELTGFLCCVIMGSYVGLLIGNTLMGIGLGLINVVCNTIAAMGEGTEETAAAFADVMAGVLSGLTIGAGLASLLFPIGGSRLSYSISAVLMVPVFFLINDSMNVSVNESGEGETEQQRIGFKEFFFNRRVLGFLFLILVPFMTSVSYREYFFPLFAVENGFQEGRIGQLYMICGLLVLYVGPYISSYVIGKFGTYKSIVIASWAMAFNMLLFVMFPGMLTAVSGMVLLSAITSFAYTCQYTYFEELPDSFQYGNGKSMGIYSVFENLGQTIGPMVYGALLTLGYRMGIGLFCVAMLLMTCLYVISMRKDVKSGKIKNSGETA